LHHNKHQHLAPEDRGIVGEMLPFAADGDGTDEKATQ
jgi:hypothetical protein